MPIGLIGKKLGMTRIFQDSVSIPVTVIGIEEHRVVSVKTEETVGYTAVQLTTGKPNRPHQVAKAIKGQYQKAGVEMGSEMKEFRLTPSEASNLQVGQVFGVDLFKEGQKVDVTALSKGRGFAGVIARHNFSSQRASHGNSLSHNAPGSIGQNQDPGRVFKGKKMAGQWGNTQVTIQNLEIIKIDPELNVILVKGALPGATAGRVVVNVAVKSKSATEAA